ncbi:5 bisphosphate carboxylase/oxygenase large subunit N-methyltransferase [Durusdinium trenchii]|uniref:Chloroplastic n=1 Tax=Durusdinium trenchii TaxID=1381693 RepID=A0ABP0MJF9_9DINO
MPMLSRSKLLRSALLRSKTRFGGFGSPKDHEPAWIERWSANRREGQDNLDWFFRLFNSTRIYETFLKSSPRFYGFIVWFSILGGYTWSRMWDHIWDYVNQGKLYRHNPYVYPIPDDDE